MTRSRIVYTNKCLHCEYCADDDGALYCSEDVCVKERTENVVEPSVQQTETPQLVGSGHAPGQVPLSGLQAIWQERVGAGCAPY